MTNRSSKGEVWQGTLAMMVLKTLEALGPLHGYGIARRIEQMSGDVLSVNYGTLYPALLKLEQEGYIASEWGCLGQQPESEVLPAHQGWAEASAQRGRGVGADDRDRRAILFVERGIVMRVLRPLRPLRALLLRFAGLFRGDRDRGFDDELESHLAMHIDDSVRAGMTPEAARRAALLKLGGVTQTREAYRDRRRLPLLDHVAQDVRFAVRTLRKTPGFALIVILTLGLGVGANAAIFSVVNATLLRPLPYPDADRLVMVYATHPKNGSVRDVMSFPEFEDWRVQSRSFEQIAAVTTRRATLYSDGDGQAEFVPAVQATPGFFEALGVAPAIGRTFQTGEEQPGTRVVVLSDGGWHHHFGGRSDVVGQSLRINEETYTVIGVMPPGFAFRTSDRSCSTCRRNARRTAATAT